VKPITLTDQVFRASDEHLEQRKRWNQWLGETLTQAAHIPIDDPIIRNERRQRAIIEKALVSLASGDTQRTRELLREL